MRDRIPKEEIEKWLGKMDEELEKCEPLNNKGEEFLENINAYVNDSKHFLGKEDLFLSWEACIWAFAFLAIGRDLGLLSE